MDFGARGLSWNENGSGAHELGARARAAASGTAGLLREHR
jgi:hypothetical protein